MSTINPLGSTSTNQTSGSSEAASSSSSLKDVNENAFLQLLVTQLKNQDPLNPMDNQEFLAQLATFNSLEQLISINQNITKLVDSTQSTGTSDSLGI
jgi:flagellar basal-body rod modification protein FlgD